MNTLLPLWSKVRKVIEAHLADRFRPAPARRRRFEVQLEFPWHLKK